MYCGNTSRIHESQNNPSTPLLSLSTIKVEGLVSCYDWFAPPSLEGSDKITWWCGHSAPWLGIEKGMSYYRDMVRHMRGRKSQSSGARWSKRVSTAGAADLVELVHLLVCCETNQYMLHAHPPLTPKPGSLSKIGAKIEAKKKMRTLHLSSKRSLSWNCVSPMIRNPQRPWPTQQQQGWFPNAPVLVFFWLEFYCHCKL